MLFENSYAKINRAKFLNDELKKRIEQFNHLKPYTLKNEHVKDSGENILVYYPTAEMPSDFPVIIGEIIHHLRSSLDLAVYDLTLKEQDTSLKNSEFPIFSNRKGFFRKRGDEPAPGSGLYKIRGLQSTTQDIIEKLQPYHDKEGKVSILSLIHDLDITDKHRTLFICRRVSKSTKLKIVKDMASSPVHWLVEFGANLEQKATIGRLLLSKPDGEHYLEADLELEIDFVQDSHPKFKKTEEVTKILSLLLKGVPKVLKYLEDSLV